MFRNVKTPSQILRVVFSIGFSVALILFTGFVVLDTLESFSRAYEKAQIVADQYQKVGAMRLENLKKQQELGYVLSAEFVEDEARSKFNYLKNGEVIFVLPSSGDEITQVYESSSTKSQTKPIEDWLKLLFN